MRHVHDGGRFAFPADELPGFEPAGLIAEPATGQLDGTHQDDTAHPGTTDAVSRWVERITEPVGVATGTTAGTGSIPPGVVSAADVGVPAIRTAATGDLGLLSSFVPGPTGEPHPDLPAPVCVDGTDVDDLIELFDRRDLLLGADYQRAYPLPDGRVLWLFQDGVVATAHGSELLHNVGLLQSGRCFQLLRGGTADQPRSYLLAELTDRYDRWFWPLGGDIGIDGRLHVFVAELREHGYDYLVHTEPVATWAVTIDPSSLVVVDARPAPDPSSALYGWSVVSDEEYTYLYAQCHRQFGWDPLWFAPDVLAHDYDCSADVTVARVPRGAFSETPQYWDGVTWGDDGAAAVPVIPTEGRPVNPTQVARWNGRFVAVTKVGDWWGDTVVLDVAPEASGPWTTYDTVEVAPECDRCNTYFASIVPYGADESSFVIGLSSNAWSGELTEHYTPTFLRVPAPSRG